MSSVLFPERAAVRSGKRRRTRPEEVLEAIRALAKQLGKTPTVKEWNAWEGRPCTRSAVYGAFGSWREALAAAGLRPAGPNREEELRAAALAGAHKLAGDLGRPPKAQEWIAAGMRPCLGTVTRYFGSWSSFLKAAGFNAVERRRSFDVVAKNRHLALEALRETARLLGHRPTTRAYDELRARLRDRGERPVWPMSLTLQYMFGSVNYPLLK